MGADLAFTGIVGIEVKEEDFYDCTEVWNCEHDVARPPAIHCSVCGKKVEKASRQIAKGSLKKFKIPSEGLCDEETINGLDLVNLGYHDEKPCKLILGKAFPHKWGDNEILHEYTTEELVDMENEILQGLDDLGLGDREVKIFMRTYWSI